MRAFMFVRVFVRVIMSMYDRACVCARSCTMCARVCVLSCATRAYNVCSLFAYALMHPCRPISP